MSLTPHHNSRSKRSRKRPRGNWINLGTTQEIRRLAKTSSAARSFLWSQKYHTRPSALIIDQLLEDLAVQRKSSRLPRQPQWYPKI